MARTASGRARPDRLILVYNADSGLRALMTDVVKKALGRGDCALCDLVYSPVGKRASWTRCAARLAIPVEELHRDQLPAAWRIGREELPCILVQHGSNVPAVLVSRDAIVTAGTRVEQLEAAIRGQLLARH